MKIINILIVLFVSFVLSYPCYVVACICNAFDIGRAGVLYEYGGMSCPGHKATCDCSGMLSLHMGINWHKRATEWYNDSYSASWNVANFAYNSSPHVTVLNPYAAPSIANLANCSPDNDCYVRLKTKQEVETYYGELRHTNQP